MRVRWYERVQVSDAVGAAVRPGEQVADVLKVVADPSRLRILTLLPPSSWACATCRTPSGWGRRWCRTISGRCETPAWSRPSRAAGSPTTGCARAGWTPPATRSGHWPPPGTPQRRSGPADPRRSHRPALDWEPIMTDQPPPAADVPGAAAQGDGPLPALLMPQGMLRRLAAELSGRFAGVFSPETVERYVFLSLIHISE